MTLTTLSRRGFLTAAAAGASAGALAACGPVGGAPAPTTSGNAELPDYRPLVVVEPDLPGEGAAVQPGYLRYPYDEARPSVTEPVGSGGTVSFLTITFGAVGTPMDQNRYWQAINEELGLTYAVQTTLADSFLQRVQTTVAGGDIPDMVTFGSNFPVPQTPALLASKFADISEHVSGSAIEDYPNLASIPTEAWRGTLFNGRIYGVPNARPTAGAPIFGHGDLFERVGITQGPASLEELRDYLREVTAPGSSVWGVPNPSAAVSFGRFAYGAPNVWSVAEDGSFTHEVESEAYLAALEWARSVHQDGSMHPDGITTEDGNRLFAARNVAATLGGATGWPGAVNAAADAGGYAVAWIPPAADGYEAVLHAGSGIGFFTALARTDDDDAIRERLRIANWMAAPFGSTEERLRQYGLPDVHHEVVDGVPVTTPRFDEERGIGFSYTAGGSIVQTNVQHPDTVATIHDFQVQTRDMLIEDPSIGLYSESASSKTAGLTNIITSAVNDIVLGRKDLGAWESELLPQWRSQGGDEMRSEYEEAYADS